MLTIFLRDTAIVFFKNVAFSSQALSYIYFHIYSHDLVVWFGFWEKVSLCNPDGRLVAT
jgi:hypothetical protein